VLEFYVQHDSWPGSGIINLSPYTGMAVLFAANRVVCIGDALLTANGFGRMEISAPVSTRYRMPDIRSETRRFNYRRRQRRYLVSLWFIAARFQAFSRVFSKLVVVSLCVFRRLRDCQCQPINCQIFCLWSLTLSMKRRSIFFKLI
jgi:hypothetical protein